LFGLDFGAKASFSPEVNGLISCEKFM
jgi:hypothetical protein